MLEAIHAASERKTQADDRGEQGRRDEREYAGATGCAKCPPHLHVGLRRRAVRTPRINARATDTTRAANANARSEMTTGASDSSSRLASSAAKDGMKK